MTTVYTPAPSPSFEPLPYQKQTIRHERKAFWALLFVLFLCTIVPFFVTKSFNITSAGPIFVWAFNFWLFGYSKMMIASLIMIGDSGKDLDKDDLDKALKGIAYRNNIKGPFLACLSFNGQGYPKANLVIRTQNLADVVIEDNFTLQGLMSLYLGSKSVWTLIIEPDYDKKLDSGDMSHHAYFEAMSLIKRNQPGTEPSTFVRRLVNYLPKGKDQLNVSLILKS
jgi:hypothetical protein